MHVCNDIPLNKFLDCSTEIALKRLKTRRTKRSYIKFPIQTLVSLLYYFCNKDAHVLTLGLNPLVIPDLYWKLNRTFQ